MNDVNIGFSLKFMEVEMLQKRLGNQLVFLLMLLPGMIIVFIYNYIPMAGIIIAFQKFIPAKRLFGPQQWVGLQNFIDVFNMPQSLRAFWNTLSIASMKIIFGMLVPIIISILLNEIKNSGLRRSIQTMIYLPNFLSWVIFSGIIIDILSPSEGIVNRIITSLGVEPIYFLGDNRWFQITMVATDVWKNFGFATIVYLAAITGIDPTLYEAAYIDGAKKWRCIWHITLPGMMPIIIVLATLNLGNILNAGFEQIFNLYNAQVYETGDIIDTLVYRMGMIDAQYGLSTAVGLFKSVISFFLISTSYYLAYKFADYRIF